MGLQPPQVQYERPQILRAKEEMDQDSADSDKLPARLEFREAGEDAFFAVVISEVNGAAVHFKLSPTYTLYMCCRYRMSPTYRPDLNSGQHGERLGVTLVKIGNIVRSTVRVSRRQGFLGCGDCQPWEWYSGFDLNFLFHWPAGPVIPAH